MFSIPLTRLVRIQPRRMAAWLAALALTPGLLGAPGFAETLEPAMDDNTMLLRTVTLEVSGYPEAARMKDAVTTAASTVAFMDTTTPMLVRMEALRQAYLTYGQNATEKNALLKSLKDRYMADQNNASKFFDYGYAQLVVEGNKNGLFFLRKANDKLTTAPTAMAYGLAQVDVDRLIEKTSTEELTTRKMDAMYKLKDALVLNKTNHLPGIWPSFVNIRTALTPYGAYTNLKTEDVSVIYVPYGNTSLNRDTVPTSSTATQSLSGAIVGSAAPTAPPANFLATESTVTDTILETSAGKVTETITETTSTTVSNSPAPAVSGTCALPPETMMPPTLKLAKTQSFDLDGDSYKEAVNFYGPDADGSYAVRVMGQDNKVLAAFPTFTAPYIMEDLDNDGHYELVVRQFEQAPYHPVHVYRLQGGCYAEDKTVSSYFQ